MAIKKVELMIDELYGDKISYKADNIYYRLYEEFDEKIKGIFVYFHSEFNLLFSFMNEKNQLNKHFNADSSRKLINVIKEFNDFYTILLDSEKQINVDERYLTTIRECERFLILSGGSTIPKEFDSIKIIRYEPIFSMATQEVRTDKEMYNLLISGDEEAWESSSYMLDLVRFLEYTEEDIKKRFSKITDELVNEIISYPCIFAYEDYCEKDANLGYITDIMVRQGKVKITIKKEATISLKDLHKLSFELDISGFEFNRTHWAIKKANLYKELDSVNIKIQNSLIDITKQLFDVAFTFAGESRDLVEQIVRELEKKIGKDNIFYDNNFISQLAIPSLDTLLQDIYRNRSKLIVVFLCEQYQNKEWCGLEFRAIKELIMEKNTKKIMFIRLDDGHVDGIFKTDGYVDGNQYTPKKIAEFIEERVSFFH